MVVHASAYLKEACRRKQSRTKQNKKQTGNDFHM